MANFIDLDFADGEYRFALPLAQIDELQRKCGCGIGQLYARTLKGASRQGGDLVLSPALAEFYALDLLETVRQGLIGGAQGTVDEQPVKVSPGDARRLVANYLQNRPLVEAWEFAVVILSAVIVGYDPPGDEGNGEAAASETQETPAS